jgi:hypothetical protein
VDFEIPEGLPLPKVCPDCSGSWNGWGIGIEDTTAFLTCTNGHEFRATLSNEEHLQFSLAVNGGELLGRPMYVQGNDIPVTDSYLERPMLLEPEFCEVGYHISIDKKPYRVAVVEAERVILAPL